MKERLMLSTLFYFKLFSNFLVIKEEIPYPTIPKDYNIPGKQPLLFSEKAIVVDPSSRKPKHSLSISVNVVRPTKAVYDYL